MPTKKELPHAWQSGPTDNNEERLCTHAARTLWLLLI